MSEANVPIQKRILVIDDDDAVREGISEYLRHEQWEVEVACSAREAFRQFDRFAPEIVLHLPDMSGLAGLLTSTETT